MKKIFLSLTLAVLLFCSCGRNMNMQNTPNGNDVKGQQTATTEISEAEAKKIALENVPGATEKDIREFKKERDDGRWEYDVKIIYDKMEYEFEIDTQTGEIIKMDKESIYD